MEEHEEDGDIGPPVFAGVRFVLLGFDAVEAAELRCMLEGAGGQEEVGSDDVPPSCTHLVTTYQYDDPACVAARRAGIAVVRALWVDHCLRHGLVNPYRVVYEPPRSSAPLEGAASLQISLTGYKGLSRLTIMALCEQMGAVYTKELSTSNTHLICYECKGEKYRFAQEHGLFLVNHLWLEDSLRLGALQPEERYSEQSGQEVDAAEEVPPTAPNNQAVAEDGQAPQVTVDEARDEERGADDAGLGDGKNEAEPMQDAVENVITGEMKGAAGANNVKVGSDSKDQNGESPKGAKPARREGWEAAGATVRVRKGLGYLAGSAQPPGWEEKAGEAHRGSPQGVQKFLDEMSSGEGAEERPAEGQSAEQADGAEKDLAPEKEGPRSETNSEGGKGSGSIGGETVEPACNGEATGARIEPASAKGGGARLKKVGETDGAAHGVEDGAGVGLEEADEAEGPVRASSKKGKQRRGKRILVDSDESSQEGAGDAKMAEGKTETEAKEEGANNGGAAGPLQQALAKNQTDEGGVEQTHGSGSNALAGVAKGGKRKKADQPAQKSAANKRKKKGSAPLPAGAEPEKASGPETDRPEGRPDETMLGGDKAAEAEAATGSTEEEKRAVPQPERVQEAVMQAKSPVPPAREQEKSPAEPAPEEEIEMGAAGTTEGGPQRTLGAEAGLGRTPGKNALVRAKPKPKFVRQVGGKANRAFRPPAKVKAADKEGPQSAAGKKRTAGRGKKVDTDAELDEPISSEAAPETGGKVRDVQEASQPDGDEGKGEAGKKRSGPAEGDEPEEGTPAAQGKGKQGEAVTEKGGKKKRKLASNTTVAAGRCSEEMVTPAKGGELHGARAGGGPKIAARGRGESPEGVATGGVTGPEEELGQASDLKKSRKGGTVDRPDQGARKNQAKGSKKVEKQHPENIAVDNADGAGVTKPSKGVASTEANKENIKSEAEVAAKAGAACGGLGSPGAAPYFAFGGTGEQKDSMLKKVKALGGRVTRLGHEFDRKTTHVLHPAPLKRTEKVLAAMAAGLWLLQPSFLTASKPASGWANEAEHEWAPGAGEAGAALDLAAPSYWRQRRADTGRRALQGLRVVLCGDFQNPTTDALKRIVQAGGGQVLASGGGPLRAPEGRVQIAIIAEGILSADARVAELLAAGAGCASAPWLLDTLSLPRGDHSQHVLFGTEAAVAAALDSVNSAPAEISGKGGVGASRLGPKAKGVLQPHKKGGNVKKSAKAGKKGGAKSQGAGLEFVGDEDDDVACGVCGRVDLEEDMLLCDGQGGKCDVAMHTFCMVPPLDRVPEGDWFCAICQDAQGKTDS